MSTFDLLVVIVFLQAVQIVLVTAGYVSSSRLLGRRVQTKAAGLLEYEPVRRRRGGLEPELEAALERQRQRRRRERAERALREEQGVSATQGRPRQGGSDGESVREATPEQVAEALTAQTRRRQERRVARALREMEEPGA